MSEAGTGRGIPIVDALLERLESVHVNQTRRDCDDGGQRCTHQRPARCDSELELCTKAHSIQIREGMEHGIILQLITHSYLGFQFKKS